MKITILLCFLITGLSAFAKPGDLTTVTHLTDDLAMNIPYARANFCPAEAGLARVYGFKRYKITFRTNDIAGREVNSAGLLIVPDTTDVMPMFVYQHGTLFGRAELPSSNPKYAEGDAAGYCFASLGYAAVLPDYLGFGDGTGVHPYLHADSEAWVARDMMRASKAALLQLNAKLDAKLFIAGYSQGGHAAMALLKFLEEDSTHEFTVTAAAPMAGPYALAETMEKILTAPSPHSTAESMYMIVGLNPLYSMYKDLNEAVRPEYVETVSTLFDGTHDWADVLSKLSMPLQDLLKPDYLQAAVTDPNSPLIKALVANQVYKWTPKTPIHLYHGGGDHEVPFANSQKAYDYMISQGANIELINLGDLVDHLPGFNLAIGQAAVWFEGFRQVSH